MHSVAVCALMVALARQLDLPEDQVHEAGMAGLLHDIGKMAMPLDVLNKPGKLSDDEYAIMRSHPERGHAMLLAAQTAVSDAVLDVCLHHHEKVDGTGYPHRLAGEEISLLARMGAICDVRRHHFEPPVQNGLGCLGLAGTHGPVARAFRYAAAARLRPYRGHLSPARWCGCSRVGSAWLSSITRSN